MARMLMVLAALAAGVGVSAAVFAHGSEAAPAAAVQRTFVSTSGSDANPCTRTEPCRSFQAALANTLAGGEVVAIDSGGYGPFTVDKSVSVIGAPGAHVAISVFSGNGITVNAGFFDAVVLRNLYLTGLGGETGISFQGGASLYVESVVLAGFSVRGLNATVAESDLVVRDSIFRNNDEGVLVDGTVRAQISDSRAHRNFTSAFRFRNGARANIVRTSATRNGSGFLFEFGAIASVSESVSDSNANGVLLFNEGTQATLSATVISNNATNGVALTNAPTARIGGSTVTGNGVGLSRTSGTLETFGDNLVRGNTTDTSGTITPVTKT